MNVSVPICHKCLQAVAMFDSMMKEILDQVGGLSSQNSELCSLLRNILQVQLLLCISNCTMSALQIYVICGILILENIVLTSLLTNILTRFCCLFQAMVQVIDALSTCVRHVGTFEEAPDLDAVRSLPTCILKILRETFQHCKVGLSGSRVALMGTF